LKILGLNISRRSTITAEQALEKAGFITTGSHSGVTVTEQSALAFSAVWACNQVLSQTIGQLPINLFKTTDNGKEIASDHYLQKIIKTEPNELMTSSKFREFVMTYYNMYGNGYAKIKRKRATKEIEELQPIPASLVTPYLNKSGRLYYKVQRGTDQNPESEIIPARDMIHIPGMGWDGIQGLSPIKIAQETIGLAIAATEFGARFFGQGTTLSGVIEFPTVVNNAARKNLTEGFKKAYQGLGKSHGIPVLEQGAKFNPISMPLEDAQYLQTRQFQVTDIARIYRVPPHKIADLSRSTNNNIEHQGIEFVQDTITPIVVAWEQELNRKLLTEDEKEKYFFKFSLNGLLRGDIKTRSAYYKEGIWAGWLSQNDIRQLEDLNKIEGGNDYWIPTNLVPIDKYDEVMKSKETQPPIKPTEDEKSK
jgi:HK97 family phage portal protein